MTFLKSWVVGAKQTFSFLQHPYDINGKTMLTGSPLFIGTHFVYEKSCVQRIPGNINCDIDKLEHSPRSKCVAFENNGWRRSALLWRVAPSFSIRKYDLVHLSCGACEYAREIGFRSQTNRPQSFKFCEMSLKESTAFVNTAPGLKGS